MKPRGVVAVVVVGVGVVVAVVAEVVGALARVVELVELAAVVRLKGKAERARPSWIRSAVRVRCCTRRYLACGTPGPEGQPLRRPSFSIGNTL